MKKQYILVSLFIFIMFGVCFADFAQAVSVTSADLKVENVGTLPTSNFYFFKQWGRGITRFFTFNPIAKAELELKITNQVAAEALEVEKISPSNTEALKDALANYTDAQERLSTRLASLKDTSNNPNIERLLKEVDERTAKHVELFEQLSERWNNDPYVEDSAKNVSIGDPDFDLLRATLKNAQSNAEKTISDAVILRNTEAQRATESKLAETSSEASAKIRENESSRPSEMVEVAPVNTKVEASQTADTEVRTGQTSDSGTSDIRTSEPNPTTVVPSTVMDQPSVGEASAVDSNTNTGSSATIEVVQAKKYEVPIVGFAFSPKTLTINKGDTVVWTNNDSAPHDVVGTNNKILSSPTLSRGQTYSFTFTETGTFEYFCSIHPSMKGSIIVK